MIGTSEAVVTIKTPAAKSLRGMAKSILTNRLQIEQQVFTQGRFGEFPREIAKNGK